MVSNTSSVSSASNEDKPGFATSALNATPAVKPSVNAGSDQQASLNEGQFGAQDYKEPPPMADQRARQRTKAPSKNYNFNMYKLIDKIREFGLIKFHSSKDQKDVGQMSLKLENNTTEAPSNWPFAAIVICIITGAIVDDRHWLSVTSAILIPILFFWLIYVYTHKDTGSVRLSYIWGLLGLSMLIFGIYSDPAHVNAQVTSVIINISGTLISLSIIGVILQLKDTKEYFASTLSDLIMKESYVEKLNRSQLEKLQKTVLERYFENSNDFNRENSFYRFFSKNLQNYIGSPYRENYRNTLSIEIIESADQKSNEKKECLITDDLVYRLRSMGTELQKNIRWKAAKDEIKNLKSFSVDIGSRRLFTWSPDQNQDSSSDFIENNFSQNPEDGIEINIDLEKLSQSNKKVRDEYIDGATVKISAEYTATNYKCITAKLLFPTKGFSLNVFHPAQIRCKVESYGFDSEAQACKHNDTPQGFSFDYSDWILPLSGVYVAIEEIDATDPKKKLTREGKSSHAKDQTETMPPATEEEDAS